MTIRIAITPGEPAGIGPDLVIKIAQQAWPAQLVVYADTDMMQQRAEELGLPLTLTPSDAVNPRIQATGWLFVDRSGLPNPTRRGRQRFAD